MKRELIRKLIYQVLTEAEGDQEVEFTPASTSRMTSASRLSDMSVDSQIDSYLLGFEKESVMSDDDSLAESLHAKSLKTLLIEADPLDLTDDEEEEGEADEEEAPAEEEPEEAEPPTPGDESEMKADQPAAPPMPRINIETFTDKVMRLSMNAEQMLDSSSVVINRAKQFLADNYDQAHLDAFDTFLETNYDLNDNPLYDEVPAAPQALGANPAGAGDMGGA